MKKISLLKSLAILGAVALTSVCVVETALLLHKNTGGSENDALIDISIYHDYVINETTYDGIHDYELLDKIKTVGIVPLSGGTVVNLTNIADLVVVPETITQNSFMVASVPNSTIYAAGKNVTIYIHNDTPTQLSSVITATPDLFLDKYESEDKTKAYILKSLQSQYLGLSINDLEVRNIENYDDTLYGATVAAKTGSLLYAGTVSITYYVSGAAVLTYAKTTLVPGDTNILPTFTFKGATQTPAYTCANVVTPVTFTTGTGAFGYATGVNFGGALYQVKASYTPVVGGPTFIAYAYMFAQPYAIPNPNQIDIVNGGGAAGWLKLFTLQATSLIEASGTINACRSGETDAKLGISGSFFFKKNNTTVVNSDISTFYGVTAKNLSYKINSANEIEIYLWSNNGYTAGTATITSCLANTGAPGTVIKNPTQTWSSTRPSGVIDFTDIAATKIGTLSAETGVTIVSPASAFVKQSGKILQIACEFAVASNAACVNGGWTSFMRYSGVSLASGNNYFTIVGAGYWTDHWVVEPGKVYGCWSQNGAIATAYVGLPVQNYRLQFMAIVD